MLNNRFIFERYQKKCPKCGGELLHYIDPADHPLKNDCYHVGCSRCDIYVESRLGPEHAFAAFDREVFKKKDERYLSKKEVTSMLNTDAEKLVNLVIDRINEGANISAIIYLSNEGNMGIEIFPCSEEEHEL